MKSTIENVSSLERRLNIEVPAEVVTGAFDRVFKSIQKDAEIKGFRQGKAPLATIKSVYGGRVKQDVLQEVLQNAFFQAIQENKVNPVSSPEFEFTVDDLQEGKTFAFTANFEIRPEVNLKNYEGLTVEKEKLELDDKRVDEVVENIKNAHAEWGDVLEDRPAQMGDMANLDFTGKLDGEPLENGAGTDFPLELGSSRFIPGFEEGIVGMKVGTTKTISLKFPENYHVAELAGKPVDFVTTLKGLKKKSLPELTPEFLAGKMGPGVETEAQLRENIKKDLNESEQKRIDSDMKNRLLRSLVRANPVDVPPSLLKEQKAALVEDMKNRLTQQGMTPDDFAAYTDKWEADFDTTAREMIQSGYLVDAVATKHELSYTDADLEKKYEEYAQQTGIDLARIKDFYSRPEQVQRLTYMITEEKVIDFLMKTAKVTEVKKENLKEKN